jgi:hypothetical protein
MSTSETITWTSLGNRFPSQEPLPRSEVGDQDTGERSDTELTVTYRRVGVDDISAFAGQTAEYSCAHGRVRLYVEAIGERLDAELAPRLALTLHAWGFGCDCYRTDWEGHFGEAATGKSLAAARRWLNELRSAKLLTALRVRWEQRTPTGKTWNFRRARLPNPQPEAA